MSLLLDALKKAAEQKAKKGKSEAPEYRSSDETMLDMTAAEGALQGADDQQRPGAHDETQLEQTQLQERLARGDRIAGDDTNLNVPEVTQTVVMEESADPTSVDATSVDAAESTQTMLDPGPGTSRDTTQTVFESDSADETLFDSGSSDETVFDQAAVDVPEVTQTQILQDDDVDDAAETTSVDSGEVTRTVFAEPPVETDGDDPTTIEAGDVTKTVFAEPPVETDDDDPTVVASGDVTKTVFAEPPVGTDIDDPTSVDSAEITRTVLSPTPQQDAADPTSIDVPETTQTQVIDEESVPADATSVDVTETPTETVMGGREPMQIGEDETVLSEARDVSEFTADQELDARRPVAREDQTDLNPAAAGVQAPPGGAFRAGDFTDNNLTDEDDTARREDLDDIANDPDLSLLLVDSESTSTGMTTGLTDPQVPADRARALYQDDESKLMLDGKPAVSEEKTDTQGATLTNSTATALHGDDTLAPPTRATITRADPTSTHTYAPDNYDRTLMKLPNDDASQLFAGMKSDADVVMTPDYAKKVFQSKTSAQRNRHYRVYFGISLILLLAVGIFGVFQYQSEYQQIDTSLQPLKRDPLPAGVPVEQEPEEINLFAETEGQVDQRTIDIIATADEEVGSAAPAAETEVAETEVVEEEPVVEEVALAEVEQPEAETEVSEQVRPEPVEVAQAPEQSSSGSLEIQTTSQYREIDVWLREAYAAYRAGNDELAMQRYSQVLEVDPNNRNALLARAAIHVQNANVDAAIADYQTLLLANPKDSIAMSSLLGVASLSPQETETRLKLMLQEEPDSPYLNFALANAFGAQGRWQEAQSHYFEALKNNPDDPNYAYNLAVSLEHISQPRTAITYYQRALENYGKGLATFSRDVVNQRVQVLGKL